MATKWGVLSTGRIANDFVTVVSRLPKTEHQFVAVAEWKLDQAKVFAQHHGIARAYGDFEQLAKDTEVEIVYIAIINPWHYSLAKMMLEHGKHLLIEKPMTLNKKMTEELTNLAKKKGLFLMEGMWPRFLPSYRLMREQIASGVIGKVYHINTNIGSKFENDNWCMKKEFGGGAILNHACYAIDMIGQVLSNAEPEQIKAVGHLNETGVDDDCSAAIQFSDNRTATLTTSSVVQLPRETLICGTKGVIKMMSLADSDDGVFKVYTIIGSHEEYHEFKCNQTKLDLNFRGSYGFGFEANAVRKCLKEGRLECPEMTHKDSIYTAQIQDRLRKELGVVYDCEVN